MVLTFSLNDILYLYLKLIFENLISPEPAALNPDLVLIKGWIVKVVFSFKEGILLIMISY